MKAHNTKARGDAHLAESRARAVRAITFDVGGTLIRPWPSVGHIYARAASEYGHGPFQPESLNRQFAAAWKAKRSFDHSRPAWLELVQKTFAGCLDQPAVQQCFPALYDRFAQADAWRIFDDARPVLKELRARGFKLGIISNWDERLRPLLTQLQLNSFFEATIISCEGGASKPAREIFERAASALGFPAGVILHVGDSADEDIDGARSAGFQARLLDREAPKPEEGSIRSLTEFLDLSDRVAHSTSL